MSTPTSGTGISANDFRSRPFMRSRGFSLLELLVVVGIIGIFLGVTVLSTDLVSFERRLEQEARRLSNLIALVSDEALMQSRDYGLLLTEDSYRFYYYDYGQLAWLLPADDRLLTPYDLGPDMRLELRIDDRDVLLEPSFDAEIFEQPEPQILIFSSGEMTPFSLAFARDDDLTFSEDRVALIAEFDGTMELRRDEL